MNSAQEKGGTKRRATYPAAKHRHPALKVLPVTDINVRNVSTCRDPTVVPYIVIS